MAKVKMVYVEYEGENAAEVLQSVADAFGLDSPDVAEDMSDDELQAIASEIWSWAGSHKDSFIATDVFGKVAITSLTLSKIRTAVDYLVEQGRLVALPGGEFKAKK